MKSINNQAVLKGLLLLVLAVDVPWGAALNQFDLASRDPAESFSPVNGAPPANVKPGVTRPAGTGALTTQQTPTAAAARGAVTAPAPAPAVVASAPQTSTDTIPQPRSHLVPFCGTNFNVTFTEIHTDSSPVQVNISIAQALVADGDTVYPKIKDHPENGSFASLLDNKTTKTIIDSWVEREIKTAMGEDGHCKDTKKDAKEAVARHAVIKKKSSDSDKDKDDDKTVAKTVLDKEAIARGVKNCTLDSKGHALTDKNDSRFDCRVDAISDFTIDTGAYSDKASDTDKAQRKSIRELTTLVDSVKSSISTKLLSGDDDKIADGQTAIKDVVASLKALSQQDDISRESVDAVKSLQNKIAVLGDAAVFSRDVTALREKASQTGTQLRQAYQAYASNPRDPYAAQQYTAQLNMSRMLQSQVSNTLYQPWNALNADEQAGYLSMQDERQFLNPAMNLNSYISAMQTQSFLTGPVMSLDPLATSSIIAPADASGVRLDMSMLGSRGYNTPTFGYPTNLNLGQYAVGGSSAYPANNLYRPGFQVQQQSPFIGQPQTIGQTAIPFASSPQAVPYNPIQLYR